MVVDQIRISVLITRKVNTENSVDMIFGSIVDGAAVLSSDTRFLDSVRIYGREFVSPSFSAPVVTVLPVTIRPSSQLREPARAEHSLVDLAISS
jgi:hypothetical protein